MQYPFNLISTLHGKKCPMHTTATFTPTTTGNNIGQNREELRQPQHLNMQFRPPTKHLYIIKL